MYLCDLRSRLLFIESRDLRIQQLASQDITIDHYQVWVRMIYYYVVVLFVLCNALYEEIFYFHELNKKYHLGARTLALHMIELSPYPTPPC